MHIDSYNEKPKRTRQRLRVEELLNLVGPERTLRLCERHGGQTLPRLDQLHRRLRREAVVAEHHTQGTPVSELAAKYNLQPSSVRRFLSEHRRQTREIKRANERLEAARMRREAAA